MRPVRNAPLTRFAFSFNRSSGAGFTLDNYGGTFPSQHREAADRFAALVGSDG